MSEFRIHFLIKVSHAINRKAEMTSQTLVITAKQSKSLRSLKSQFQEVRVRRNKNLLDVVRKHSMTSPDVQFKEFPLT